MSVPICLKHLTKIFNSGEAAFKAVDDVNLQINAGELVTLLGPSGCGKTTILRMIAGFETPTEGQVFIGKHDVTSIAANKRNIGFVFQNYALFPHMTVFDNIAYGLKIRKLPTGEIVRRVAEALETVSLGGIEDRFPNQLSGGEQQRVALARVLVINPQVLLMDEPLSNLDAKLRIYMRSEIRSLQKRLGITCVYVTHDQKEALALADRIAVLNGGKVEQIATPFELYTNPTSLFVADFIGQANILKGKLTSIDGNFAKVLISEITVIAYVGEKSLEFKVGDEVAAAIRPESIEIVSPDDGTLRGQIVSSVFLGDEIEYVVKLASGDTIRVVEPYRRDGALWQEGQGIGLHVDPLDVRLLAIM
ncbi:MAG TPA: ABC transporter ATP-binding protein [Acetomicrobium flavidum]|uniref:ABC transporter ATP-binding protein n=1 Tax=Acetomicrobium flavidum TaxID=49896 RepID=UPI002C5E3581|nr:ABC transporter ATP-binding protein [Acetomicrobium flavidum]